jgi:hypothetical protein
MTQVTAAVDFIKSKGPFPQGELVLVAGNFNIDANISGVNKNGSGINEKLLNPETNLLVAARKAEIEGEYSALVFALGGTGVFDVLNTNFLKARTFVPTEGVCAFTAGVWTPQNNWGYAADQCTNKVSDYIFQLAPKGAMLAPMKTKKKVKTRVNYAASANPEFKTPAAWNSTTPYLTDHNGVQAQIQF